MPGSMPEVELMIVKNWVVKLFVMSAEPKCNPVHGSSREQRKLTIRKSEKPKPNFKIS